mmetsp:Transcript_113847/g.367853  ORF Transcript_113847/g.367853 Transcript_113847/m.367853 type:complete len:279 (+) Transcript_113847:1355-2191(+)
MAIRVISPEIHRMSVASGTLAVCCAVQVILSEVWPVAETSPAAAGRGLQALATALGPAPRASDKVRGKSALRCQVAAPVVWPEGVASTSSAIHGPLGDVSAEVRLATIAPVRVPTAVVVGVVQSGWAHVRVEPVGCRRMASSPGRRRGPVVAPGPTGPAPAEELRPGVSAAAVGVLRRPSAAAFCPALAGAAEARWRLGGPRPLEARCCAATGGAEAVGGNAATRGHQVSRPLLRRRARLLLHAALVAPVIDEAHASEVGRPAPPDGEGQARIELLDS